MQLNKNEFRNLKVLRFIASFAALSNLSQLSEKSVGTNISVFHNTSI